MHRALTYNIPIELFEAYLGRSVIVRTHNPTAVVENLAGDELTNLRYVQLLSLSPDAECLTTWNPGTPIDLVMYEPQVEVGRLYSHVKLLDTHPVRISIPVRAGFANAAKVALSLQFAVKLIIGQPTKEDVVQMLAALYMFLHKPSVSQPLEFYQSMLFAFLRNESSTIWSIQEEDPARCRYVTRDGREIVSPRFMDSHAGAGFALDTFVDDFERRLLKERRECANCEFLGSCRGYFKWPNKDYICAGGIRQVLAEIQNAARELEIDLAAFSEFRSQRSAGPP